MIDRRKAVRYRSYQKVMHVSSRFLPWRRPELIEGKGSVTELGGRLKQEDVQRALIVTDEGIRKVGLVDPLVEGLRENGVETVVYDGTVPNPTVDNVLDALHLFQYHHCQAIIAIGGGSAIDCAKGVAAKAARPDKMLRDMKGLFGIRRPTPLLVAVPTTSGTGSEATAATVLSNPETKEKYPIIDLSLIPDVAVLDISLVLDLPGPLTAMTGMDALTHAVEAYIGKSNTKETDLLSRKAVRLIFRQLVTSYRDPHNEQARSDMQKAAYYAGLSFTKAYVGYVHSVAHTLGGFYGTPHGLANAVLLPHVLDFYGTSVHPRLADLADSAGVTDRTMTTAEKAETFIAAIRELNRNLGIPSHIEGIRREDLPSMVEQSMEEAHPLYPVPKFMNAREMSDLYQEVSDIKKESQG